ncbi:hypothetical protein F2Q65_17760 [Thiohalocapsa marina]|uniref:Core-binding (CB) domain-containing protein n=1 Tax=Thiohalocapsa marina TaxID=424902 RepID=A0A5M8FFL3_9GAMM|nr:hypothetical protein [Thiohalocapsa marina]KAA6182516.1 hypothetical protein F2Q65_17760 [Thiohalocapsa marina]
MRRFDRLDAKAQPLAADYTRLAHDLAAGRAESTQRAHRADWQRFCDWCEPRGHPALPALPEIVAAYLAAEADAGRKVATLRVAPQRDRP